MTKTKDKEVTQEMVAENLVLPLWRALDKEYKKKYKKTIWDQFENRLRSAAYTSDIKKFLQKIKSNMRISIRYKDLKRVLNIVDSNQDRQILKWIREETQYLVLQVRVINQERKQAQKNLFDAQETASGDEELDQLLNQQNEEE